MRRFWIIAALACAMMGCEINADIDCDDNTELSLVWGEKSLAQPLYAVVAGGAAEPKSLGSYSVRIYQHNVDAGKQDVFITGEILARDGFLKSVELADVDGDLFEELIVVFESAGTGSYLTAHAWRFLKGELSVVAHAENLSPTADVTQALSAQIKTLNALSPTSEMPNQ